MLVFQFSCKLNHFPTPSFLGYGSEELVFGEMTWFFNPSDDCIRVSWTTYTKNSIEIFLRRYLPMLLFNCFCLTSSCGGLCCVAFLLIVLFRLSMKVLVVEHAFVHSDFFGSQFAVCRVHVQK